MQPHLLTALVKAHEGAAERLASRQVAPQLVVGIGVGIRLLAKQAVMFATDLLDAVAHGLAKAFVGIQDHSRAVELDHRHGAADSGKLGVGFGEGTGKTLDFLQVGFVLAVEHGQITLDSRRLEGAFHSYVGYFWYTCMGK